MGDGSGGELSPQNDLEKVVGILAKIKNNLPCLIKMQEQKIKAKLKEGKEKIILP